MLRIVLALAVLGIVLVTMTKMTRSQLGNLSVTGAPPQGASAATPTPVAAQIQRSLDAGMATRASAPTP
jgi:hypothetical protein